MDKNYINVSVCISVHNTAKYLPRCLDSVLAQTLKSIEIVLVNNGSTDESEEIMRQYAKKFPAHKWVIIAQEDRGLAQGRQSGINNATGKYLAFLDADDLVAPSMYEDMLLCAEKYNCDIVEVDTVRDGIVLASPYEGLQDAHTVLKEYFTTGGIQSMLWLRLYKRELFEKAIMPELYTNNEDMFGLPCLLYAAKDIYFLHKPLHTYSTDNEGAVMKTTTTDPKLRSKYYNNRIKALKCFPHFKIFASDGFGEFAKEYKTCLSRYAFAFICEDFGVSSYKQKLQDAAKAIEFNNPSELITCIKQNIQGERRIKTLGFYLAYLSYNLQNKLHNILK